MPEMSIRDLRRAAGMTQVELASAVGVKQSTVAEWERGTSFPMASKLPALAALFGCTIDELFRDPQKEAPGPGAEGR